MRRSRLSPARVGAGAGGGLLLLIIAVVVVVVCCCRASRRNKRDADAAQNDVPLGSSSGSLDAGDARSSSEYHSARFEPTSTYNAAPAPGVDDPYQRLPPRDSNVYAKPADEQRLYS